MRGRGISLACFFLLILGRLGRGEWGIIGAGTRKCSLTCPLNAAE